MNLGRPARALRYPFLLLLWLLCMAASAQDVLKPRWMVAGWPNLYETPQYSVAGDRLLLWKGSSGSFSSTDYSQKFRVYQVSDHAILAQVNFAGPTSGFGGGSTNGDLTGACFSSDGTKVFYATDHGFVFSFDIATRTISRLSTNEFQGSDVYDLVASKDGKYLAYVADDPASTNDLICIYDLAADTKKSFPYVNAGARTAGLAFADNNSKIVTSGPTIYDLNGVKRAQGAFGSDPFVVSPDGSAIFSFHNQSTGHVYSYTASTLSPRWDKNAPEGASEIVGVSSDGIGVFFTAYRASANGYGISGLLTSSGNPIINPVVTARSIASPQVAVSPASNSIFVAYSSFGELWNVSSSGGAGSLVAALYDGVADGRPPTFEETKVLSGDMSTVAVVTDELHASGNARVVRNAYTGAKLGTLPAGAHISADGQYYVLISGSGGFGSTGGNGINVYRTLDGQSAASLHVDGGFSRVLWGGSSRFIIANNSSAKILDFDGSSLSERTTISLGGVFGSSGIAISPDGSRYCLWDGAPFANGCRVYDAGSLTLIATIDKDTSTSNGVDGAIFAGANLIGVHESLGNSSATYQNEYRVYDLSIAPPRQVRKIRYAASGNLNGTAGSLSPDGEIIVLGHNLLSKDEYDNRGRSSVRLYAVSTGTILNQWDDQFLPDFGGVQTFTFSQDSRTVRWTADGAIVVAPTSVKLSLTLDPTSVAAGSVSTGTVTLGDPAEGNQTVTLASSSGAATVPDFVIIPNGQTSATFEIDGNVVDSTTTTTISATLSGRTSSAPLTVTVPSLDTFTLSPSEIAPGTSTTGTISITDPAPAGGLLISLSSSVPTATLLPNTVSVPEGAKTVDFEIKGRAVTARTSLTITAKRGTVTRKAPLTVAPPVVIGVTLSPSDVLGGSSSQGTVTVSSLAPPNGTIVTLNPGLATVGVPATVTVPEGSDSATFTITTKPLANTTTVAIKATCNLVPRSANLRVLAIALQSFSVNPTTVVGGVGTASATVQLQAPLPNDVTVTLASSKASVASLPSSVTIPAGQASITVTVTTTGVTADTPVTFTATLGGAKTATLTVKPIELSGVAVNPTSVFGGSTTTVTGTVSFSGPAPFGGAKVTLTSSATDAATVPATITIPAGQTSVSFPVTHKGISIQKSVTITAKFVKISKICALLVQGPTITSLSFSPPSVKGGSTTKVMGLVTISNASAAGAKITLKSSNTSAVTVPSSVPVAKGAATAMFPLTHKKVKISAPVTITATMNGVFSATFTVTP